MKKNNKFTINEVVHYCPRCSNGPKIDKTNGDKIAVALDCEEHKANDFVPTGTGIMIVKKFKAQFKAFVSPVVLSSQEI